MTDNPSRSRRRPSSALDNTQKDSARPKNRRRRPETSTQQNHERRPGRGQRSEEKTSDEFTTTRPRRPRRRPAQSQGRRTSSHQEPESSSRERRTQSSTRRKPQVKRSRRTEPRIRLEHANVSPQIDAMKSESQRGNRFENRFQRASSIQLPQKIQDKFPEAPKNSVRVIPLGGLLEVGKNMYAYEYGDDIILVDVGTAFPDEMHPGIDLIVPDMDYIFSRRDKVRGIFITHGHEDHIGALPWLVRRVSAPIYCTPLTAKLIDHKLRDKGAPDQVHLINIVKAGDTIKRGAFEVEFIHVNHSIADACALALHTPAGIVIHSGDFKVDFTPIHGDPINLARLAELGEEGVLLFLCESTNVEREGFSMSESSVGEAFEEQFSKADGRIFVATFSSNVHRVQQIVTAAEAHGRKVVLLGRSMLNVFGSANDLGYIHMKQDTLIELDDVRKYKDHELCIVMTGSQGEPLAALTRIAYAEHRNFQVNESDTIIISATPIPGNEKSIFRVIDELYKRGAHVVYSQLADVHVSGHAHREEIRLLHSLIKPKYFIPIHGEYRMLHHHAELSHELGTAWENIFILNNGDVFACSDNFADVVGYTSANPILMDGRTFSPANTETLQERNRLMDDGVLSLSLTLDSRNGRLRGLPALVSYGFFFESDTDKLEERTLEHVQKYLERNKGQGGNLRKALESAKFRLSLESYLFRETGRKPVVLITVLEG